MSVQLIFTKQENLGSWAIRAATMSPWSHVVVPYNDWVVEATWRNGVHTSLMREVIRGSDAYAFGEIETPLTQSQVFHACMSQCGKDYDKGAVFGMPFGRDWQDDNKWFCSELTEWGFLVNGAPNFAPDKMHRVTPRDLWMLTR